MVEFQPDEVQETKEPIFKTTSRSPRDVYSGWPSWLKTLAKIVAAVVIIVALILIGRAIHHHIRHGKASSQAAPVARSSKSQGATSQQKKSTGGSANSSPNTTVNPNSQLPNSGPGDVLALFTAASAVGAATHYTLNRRYRQN